jgi:hypothetical protein
MFKIKDQYILLGSKIDVVFELDPKLKYLFIWYPISSTIKLLSTRNTSGIMLWLEIFKYLGMFLILGLSFGATIVYAAYNLFSILTTNLNEYDEISKNNVGVALLLAVLTIVIAMFTKQPFIIFSESFIPYPELPNIM